MTRDERSQVFPREIWVKRALDALVTAKLAVPGDDSDRYTILYKVFRDDVLARFVKLTEGSPPEEKEESSQTSLELEDEKYE